MIFRSEAGLLARFDVRKFTPGDANEQAVRDELAPHFEKVSFPVVQVAPGQYMKDSDALISHYAAEASIDPSGMVLLNYYRSEARRVGKECVSTCRSRGSTYH